MKIGNICIKLVFNAKNDCLLHKNNAYKAMFTSQNIIQIELMRGFLKTPSLSPNSMNQLFYIQIVCKANTDFLGQSKELLCVVFAHPI